MKTSPVPASPEERRPAGESAPPAPIRLLPLAIAILVMIGITAWPGALVSADGHAHHGAAMALFWSMSAGFVSGVGYQPRIAVLRLLFSPAACVLGLGLAIWQVGAPIA